jgi:hypothetical protein
MPFIVATYVYASSQNVFVPDESLHTYFLSDSLELIFILSIIGSVPCASHHTLYNYQCPWCQSHTDGVARSTSAHN